MSRKQILAAAAQIFSLKGYHATSMQDIAQAVNLQKPSLYHHIESKQEILRALLEDALETLILQLQAVVVQPLPPSEKIRLAIQTYLQALADNYDQAAVLLYEHRSLDESQHKEHIPYRDRFEDLWEAIIQEGISAGQFHHPAPDMAVKALLGSMNWVIMWYRPDGPMAIQQIANHFADLFIHGINSSPHQP